MLYVAARCGVVFMFYSVLCLVFMDPVYYYNHLVEEEGADYFVFLSFVASVLSVMVWFAFIQ